MAQQYPYRTGMRSLYASNLDSVKVLFAHGALVGYNDGITLDFAVSSEEPFYTNALLKHRPTAQTVNTVSLALRNFYPRRRIDITRKLLEAGAAVDGALYPGMDLPASDRDRLHIKVLVQGGTDVGRLLIASRSD
ncbi:hypothetical protein BJX99DRAFT_260895 [Aspergillus californicus]